MIESFCVSDDVPYTKGSKDAASDSGGLTKRCSLAGKLSCDPAELKPAENCCNAPHETPALYQTCARLFSKEFCEPQHTYSVSYLEVKRLFVCDNADIWCLRTAAKPPQSLSLFFSLYPLGLWGISVSYFVFTDLPHWHSLSESHYRDFTAVMNYLINSIIEYFFSFCHAEWNNPHYCYEWNFFYFLYLNICGILRKCIILFVSDKKHKITIHSTDINTLWIKEIPFLCYLSEYC